MSRSQELEPRAAQAEAGQEAHPEAAPAHCHAHTDPAGTLIPAQQERSLLQDKLSLHELLGNF